MATATGTRVVPESRADVWRALAVLEPYCAVCDVSYVVGDGGRIGKGTAFVCAPGRLDGDEPAAGAPRGEILEWVPRKLVATRLVLTTETWTTRIELADAEGGGTRVTMTVALEADGGSRIIRRIQRSAAQQHDPADRRRRAGEDPGAPGTGRRYELTCSAEHHDRANGASAAPCGGIDRSMYGVGPRLNGWDGSCADDRRRTLCSRFSVSSRWASSSACSRG